MTPATPQMVPYTETVSPLTDLALVYGTEGFQMGFGFATVTMPQVRALASSLRVTPAVGIYCRPKSSTPEVRIAFECCGVLDD